MGEAASIDMNIGLAEVAPQEQTPRERRPYQPLDGNGRLQRERADDSLVLWSRVPVGLEAATTLFHPFGERERWLLRALAEWRYLSVEQMARRFYGSYARAYEVVVSLFTHRFLARFDRTPYWMGRALGAANRPPHVYFLDWNGFYLLEGEQAVEVRKGRPGQVTRWKPDSIAIPNALTGHLLGVSEIWSLLYSAARTTQRGDTVPALSLAWKGEAAARVKYGNKRTDLLAPDAEIVVRSGSHANGPAFGRAQQDWELAEFSSDAGRHAEDEKQRYRTLLLEYETGAHRDAAVIAKIAGYNAMAAQGTVWRERYGGVFPRLMVVVREASQVSRMAALWRQHYGFKLQPGQRACPLLLTSLEHLRTAERNAGGVFGRCWKHALDPDAGNAEDCAWLTFADALGLATSPAEAS